MFETRRQNDNNNLALDGSHPFEIPTWIAFVQLTEGIS